MIVKLVARTMIFCLAILIMASADLSIIPRNQWNALQPKANVPTRPTRPATHVVIHISQTNSCSTDDDCKRKVQQIQDDHMTYKGFNDIGYNFLIGNHGVVYEGCGWDVDSKQAGRISHKSISVCLIGRFKDTVPSNASIQALIKLIEFGKNITKLANDSKVIGHKTAEINQNCPGNKVLNTIRPLLQISDSI